MEVRLGRQKEEKRGYRKIVLNDMSPKTSFSHLESTSYLLTSANNVIIPRIHQGINVFITSKPLEIIIGNTIQETPKDILQ